MNRSSFIFVIGMYFIIDHVSRRLVAISTIDLKKKKNELTCFSKETPVNVPQPRVLYAVNTFN